MRRILVMLTLSRCVVENLQRKHMRTGYVREGHFVSDDYGAFIHYINPCSGSFLIDFLCAPLHERIARAFPPGAASHSIRRACTS